MSGAYRDGTANEAVGNVTRARGARTFHTFWCHQDGGTGYHGRKGFICEKCSSGSDDRELALLTRLDRLSGQGR